MCESKPRGALKICLFAIKFIFHKEMIEWF